MKIRRLSCLAVLSFASVSAASAALPAADGSGKITLTESVTVGDAAGAAALAAATALEIPEGVTLTYTASAPLALAATVSGKGVFSAQSAGLVTLSADNSGLVAPGHFDFAATPVLVTSETGLGGLASAAVTFKGNSKDSVTNNMLRFIGPTSVFTNYAPIAMSSNQKLYPDFYFGAQNAGDKLVQAGNFSVTQSQSGYDPKIYFKNDVEFICEKVTFRYRVHLKRAGGSGCLRFGENVDAEMGHSYLAIVYHPDLHLACRSLTAKNGFSAESSYNVLFEKDHCLSPETPLRPFARGNNGVFFNLNGYDQTVAYLGQMDVKAGSRSTVSTAVPAELTAAGEVTGSTTVRYRFTGPLSYHHATPYETTFTEYKLAATGALTVSKGSVTFASGSGWAGDVVTVKDGGTLSCESPVSLNSGNHALTVESGGTLNIADGVEIYVASAMIGSVELPYGRLFTLDEVRELTDGEGVTLTGSGMIRTAAKSISGVWAGWPEAGSTNAVAIPDGTEVVLSDEDIAKFSALSRIEGGPGARILCRTTQSPFVLETALAGGVRFEARDCGTVVLAGDNSGLTYPGGFVFSNTTVIVSNRWGLGSRATAPATFWPAAPLNTNRSTLSFGGDARTNDAELVFYYGFNIGYRDASGAVVLNNRLTQKNGHYQDMRQARFTGNVTLGSNVVMTAHTPSLAENVELMIGPGATLLSSWGTYGNGYVRIAGQWTGEFAIEQGTKRFVFERDNAISASAFRFYDASAKEFFFDLNGFDQCLPHVRGNSYFNQHQQCFDVISATPATLTLNGKGAKYGAAIRCLDQASLTYAGASTQTIGFATSTTKGALTVDSGAIALERNAKWLGTNVVVNGGRLIVRPGAATNTFGVGRATVTDLFMNGDGKLELLSDAYVSTVRSVTRDGELLDRGVYSAANCDWIEGPGSIRAVSGNPVGFNIIVR